MTTPEERKSDMKAPLVYQEIMSYIKGSAEALDCESGKLSLEQYLEVIFSIHPDCSFYKWPMV